MFKTPAAPTFAFQSSCTNCMTDTGEVDNPSARGATGHVPVLPAEVVALLNPQPGQVCLDCTIGRGGHGALIVPRLSPGGRYVGFDVDPVNLEFARARLAGTTVPVDLRHANFAGAPAALAQLGIGRVDLLLADLGFSSNQMENPERGFSFNSEGPLDMRLNPDLTSTAADLVNTLSEQELANLIYRLGEDRLSRRIARKIVETRARSPIISTRVLAEVVRQAYGTRSGAQRLDPATRTFMALRIAVNAELEALTQLLHHLPELLTSGGRAVFISFHSLEDRLVKQAFAQLHRAGKARRLTPKPVTADEDERRDNPRSRSAKLRALEML
jgi:16S rRNA (cytosine1402-N4)-methyltransferase